MKPARHPVRFWGIVPAAGLSRRMGQSKQSLRYRGATLTATVVAALLDAGVDGLVVVTRTTLVDSLRLPPDARIRLAINDDPKTEMIDSVRIGLGALERIRIPRSGSSPPEHKSEPASPRGLKPAARYTKSDSALEEHREPAHAEDATGAEPPQRDYLHPSPNDGVIVIPADMPSITSETCRICLDAYRCAPGHVVIAALAGRRGHPIIFPFSMCDTISTLQGGLNELPKLFPQKLRLIDVGDSGVLRDVDTKSDYEELSQ